MRKGFTLIELSIVLVIIGLIIGGVLVGQNLINAATVRAQVSQIEKYNAAVNTFRGKYGYLPGDIPDPAASNYSFTTRGQYAGEGDGNGILEGVEADGAGNNSGYQWGSTGEVVMFWADLSKANLIDNGFTLASPTAPPATSISGTALASYFPRAKIGGANYLSVISDNNVNFYILSALTSVPNTNNPIIATEGLTVINALAIDTKIDDGLPRTGRVLGVLNSGGSPVWAIGGGSYDGSANPGGTPAYNGAESATAISCSDNNNTASPVLGLYRYSTTMNNGAGINCALSFKFQ